MDWSCNIEDFWVHMMLRNFKLDGKKKNNTWWKKEKLRKFLFADFCTSSIKLCAVHQYFSISKEATLLNFTVGQSNTWIFQKGNFPPRCSSIFMMVSNCTFLAMQFILYSTEMIKIYWRFWVINESKRCTSIIKLHDEAHNY